MTSYTTANTISDLFRDLFALLDEVAYSLLGFMYEILFNVAGADIFETTPDIIKDFYYRVQLIIGVFMVFKLAVSIIQGIINPDTFMDKKAGASSLIGRIVFALILLVALAPINIPKPTNGYSSYQENLVNNGLLFGTIYELQDRILNNNTLGRLILGKHATNSNDTNQSTTQNKALAKQSDNFSVTILKGFIHINILETATSEKDSANHVCDLESNDLKGFKKVYDEASKGKTTPKKLLSIINADCTNNSFKSKGKVYAFTYIPIISTIMAGLFIYILLGEIITIAIRSLKLAVLRLLAPIPVISYIDPKSAKDGAFGSWVKALTSTYLELFIHLAVIYFIIYLIQSIISSPKGLNIFGEGIVGIFSGIFVFVGLFFFIKQAPKFIKDMLGIKGSPGGNLGLSGILAATGALRQGGNFREVGEAFMDSTRANVEAYNQGKAGLQLGQSYEFGRDEVAKLLTGDNNMTGRKMSRGIKHLRAMNISTPQANQMKANMRTAEDNANAAADLYDRFNKGAGNYTEAEVSALLGSDYNATDSNDVKRQKLYAKKVELVKNAAKLKSDYEDVKGMQKKYGQARSFEAEYSARRFDNRAAAGITSTANGVYDTYGKEDEYGNRRYVDIPNRQRFRSQDYKTVSKSNEATSAENPRGSGVDMTPIGSTGAGSVLGDHDHDHH